MGLAKNDLRRGVERNCPCFNFLGIRGRGKRDAVCHHLSPGDCAQRDRIACRGYYRAVTVLLPYVHFCEIKDDGARVETYRDSPEGNVFGSSHVLIQPEEGTCR